MNYETWQCPAVFYCRRRLAFVVLGLKFDATLLNSLFNSLAECFSLIITQVKYDYVGLQMMVVAEL